MKGSPELQALFEAEADRRDAISRALKALSADGVEVTSFEFAQAEITVTTPHCDPSDTTGRSLHEQRIKIRLRAPCCLMPREVTSRGHPTLEELGRLVAEVRDLCDCAEGRPRRSRG